MAESATHLVDEVFPKKPMRQWVLTFPFQLRFLFAREPKIMGEVLSLVNRTLSTFLIKKAGLTRKSGGQNRFCDLHPTLREKPFLSQHSGFSLHAGVSTKAHQREKLERICRYISRPSLSEQRLSMNSQGKINSTGQSYRLGVFIVFGHAQFTSDHPKGFLVAGEKALFKDSLVCDASSSSFQADRSRSGATDQGDSQLSNLLWFEYSFQMACSLGFVDPSRLDIDSTVQEANMSYPSDACLLKKLAQKCYKVLLYLQKQKKSYLPSNITIDMKSIVKAARSYFFLAKNCAKEKKREVFSKFHRLVKSELKDFIKFSEDISPQSLPHLPWNHQEAVKEVKQKARRYLLDVAHFVRTQTIKPGKILSLRLCAVACIRKGKLGKENEFGRVSNWGRMGGNFVVPYTCTSVKMNDKRSLPRY